MHQAINNVAKAPMIARYTWLAIMVAAMICADQWGVAKQQITHLLTITIMYGVSVELTKRLMVIRQFNPQHSWVTMAGFIGDLLAWSAFIYYSGGAANPLITLFLTVIAVASMVMSTVHIIGLSMLSVGLYTLLWYCYVPLTLNHHDHAVGQKLHLLGMFGVFIFAAIMLTALTVYFKQAMSRSYQALEQAQQAIHQQRRLLAISSLAANIAHEMSTPIASMQLLSDDIAQQLEEDDELLDDIKLLQSQIDVCRQSLHKLKSHIQSNALPPAQSEPLAWVTSSNLPTLLPKVVNDWQFINPHVEVALNVPPQPIDVPLSEEQLYSIVMNMLNNAMQAQATMLSISVQLAQNVMIIIEDNGQGIDSSMVQRIQHQIAIESDHGLGLGLTIAKTVIEYVGGHLELTNKQNSPLQKRLDDSGTCVKITLPVIDAPASLL